VRSLSIASPRRAGYAAAVVAAVAGLAGLGPEAFEGLDALEGLEAIDLEILERLRPSFRGDLLLWALTGGATLLTVRHSARLEGGVRALADARRIRSAWSAAIAALAASALTLTAARTHRAMAPAKRRLADWIRRNIRSPGAADHTPLGSDLTQKGCTQ
jgi:hypothetical protein